MTLGKRLERIIRILLEEADINDKNVIEAIKRLRASYEFWQEKYKLSHRVQDYSLFQKDFREYCRLIDSGVVPRSIIEQLDGGTQKPFNPESPKKILSSKQVMAQGIHRTVKDKSHREKEIMEFFERYKEFYPLAEIKRHIPVSSRHLRELLADLVNKGILEREKIKRLYQWRKKKTS